MLFRSEDPSARDPGLPVRRRARTGRSTLLTVDADDADVAVAWAASQHASGRIEGYSLAPSSLEDAYLALTAPGGSADDVLERDVPLLEEARDA